MDDTAKIGVTADEFSRYLTFVMSLYVSIVYRVLLNEKYVISILKYADICDIKTKAQRQTETFLIAQFSQLCVQKNSIR